MATQPTTNNGTLDKTELPYSDTPMLAPRLEWFKHQFDRCAEVVYREFKLSPYSSGVLIYMDGLFNIDTTEQHFLEPLLSKSFYSIYEISNYLFDKSQSPVSNIEVINDSNEAINAILNGQGICFIEGDKRILGLPFFKFDKRAVMEAPNESVLRGPREAFVESIATNVSLLRRRIKSYQFKTEEIAIGRYSKTRVIIAYLEGVCKESLVEEMKLRLSYIDIDGILGSSYLEEIISDHPNSPFTQVQYTERPDTVSASILEGRIALLVDNTPIVLLAPTTFFIKMQSAEDYYQNYIAASWIRLIRYTFLFISLLLPSVYIAVTTFHPEMIPFNLLMSVSASREIVPFPALLEAFIMEVSFEALREASVRIPKSIGQTVSIIGALIIGTAAVQAGIVSAAMVIIVSVTGIASFIIPSFDLGLTFRLLRFPMMLLAGMLGIFGIAFGMIMLYVHMVNLESFGVPYLSPIAPVEKSSLKDVFTRTPWWKMNIRPTATTPGNVHRSSREMRAWTNRREEPE